MRRVLWTSLTAIGLALSLNASDARANFCFEFNRCTHAKLSFTIPSFYFGWYCPPANCAGPACGPGHGHGHSFGYSFGHAPSYEAYGYAGQAMPWANPNYAYYYGNQPYGNPAGYAMPQQPTGMAGAIYPTPAQMPNFYQPANYSVAPYGNVNFTLTGFGQ